MKKIIFFVLFVCCASFVQAQSSKSIGLTTSYSFTDDPNWMPYKTPQIGLVYNHFFNERHGIISELGVYTGKGTWTDLLCKVVPIKDYNFNYSLHYLIKRNQFFVKSGFNAQFFRFIIVSGGQADVPEHFKNNDDPIFIQKKNAQFGKDQIEFVPEFHFALGRDFDLGKINIRVNGFVEKAFIVDDYFDFGLSTGVFYQFGQ